MPRSTVARAFGVAALGLAAGLAVAPASAQGLLTNHRVSSRSLPAAHDHPEAQGDKATAPRTLHKARRRE